MDEKNKQYSKEAEDLLKTNPKLLLKKINSIVFWSYFYFVFILVFSTIFMLAALAAYFYLKIVAIWLALIAGGTAYAIYKGLFYSVKLEPEYLLSPEEYPSLFNLIKEVEQKLSVKIHKVYLDSSTNAGVIQKPQFGVFGGYENILIIGIQFLLLISDRQFPAVIAHELTHISNDDSRSTGGAVRIRNSWGRMIIALSNTKKWSAKPILWFLNKTWPRLDAYTFAYSRMGEQKADNFSVEYAGKQEWAKMLVRLYVSSFYVDKFFEDLHKQYKNKDKPPHDVIEKFIAYLLLPIEKKDLQEWVTQSAFEYTRTHDTHPALEERLQAQGFDVSIESILELVSINSYKSAAQSYLGNNYNELINYFNKKIFEKLSLGWQDFVEYQKTLDEVISSKEDDSLESQWRKISAQIQKDGLKSVEDKINKILSTNPEEKTALYYKGLILLEENNEKGEEIILDLIKSKKVLYAEAYQPLYVYYSKNNLRDKGRELEKLVELENQNIGDASVEINTLSLGDTLKEHDLSTEKILELQKCGAKSSGIASIHIAEKVLGKDLGLKTYVVVVKEKWWHMYSQSTEAQIIENILNCLPSGHVFIQRSNYLYARKIKNVSNSKIYTAKMRLKIKNLSN